MSVGPLFASLLGDPPRCESRESANPMPVEEVSPPANLANPANPVPEIRKLAGFARVPGYTKALQERIAAMAERWHYSPEDLAEALECAKTDPAKWLSAVEQDEQRNKLARQVGRKYPC